VADDTRHEVLGEELIADAFGPLIDADTSGVP